MSDLSSSPDLKAIARRWSFVDPDADFRLTVSDSRQPGVLLVALHEAPKDVTALLIEVTRLRARFDDLTGQVAGRDETIQRVRDRHSPMKIYEICEHDDGECPEPIEVEATGATCEDGYLYSICRECCTEGGEQTEVCATYHDHRFRPLCPTRIDIDGDPADDGSQK